MRRHDAGGCTSVVCIAPQAEAARYADRLKTVVLSVKPKGVSLFAAGKAFFYGHVE